MKKKFECGHSGKGKYCHRCKESQKEVERELHRNLGLVARDDSESVQRMRLKAIRYEQEKLDIIDLSILKHLPVLQDKARNIMSAMSSGGRYSDFGGKRLLSMKNEILSIPVGNSYRLIYRVNPLIAVELLSHEDYNNKYVT